MASANRAVLGFLFLSASSVAWLAAACGNYTPPDVAPDQGPANGLSGKQLPGPPDEEGGSGVASSSGTGSSSGSSSGTGSSSGAPAGPFLCQQAPLSGTIVDGGPCTVSFATDIFPKMQATGTWGCAATGTCHGGLQPPLLTTNTAAAFYTALANASAVVGGASVPYVDPCSTTPAQSAFVCSTLATGTTGACTPQMPTSAAIPTADNATIATWVACGAPFN